MHIDKLFYYFKLVVILSPFVLLLTVAFHLDGGKSLLSKAIPIACATSWFFFRKEFPFISNYKTWSPFFITSIIVFIYFTVDHLLRNDMFSLPRTLLLSLLYIAFIPWHRIPKVYIHYIFACSGIIAGVSSLYEHFILNINRVGEIVNPIPYALFCASLSTLCLYLFFLVKHNYKVLSFFLLLGVVFSVVAVLLTSVRGVILFLPFILILVFLWMQKNIGIKTLIKCFALFVLLSSLSYFIFQKQIDNRIDNTMQEINQIQKGNYNTSFGIRLSLWKHGIDIFKRNWLIGMGTVDLKEYIRAKPDAKGMNHLHNQYIDTLARHGILGMSVILIWLCSVLMRIKDSKFYFKFNPILTSILLLYLLASLTDVPLHHTHLVYFYAIISGMFLYFEEEAT